MSNVKTIRIELEFSIVWISDNPKLFRSDYEKFFDTYSGEYEIRSEVRKGFLTLIAERRVKQLT